MTTKLTEEEEDRLDLEDLRAAKREFEQSGEPAVSLDEVLAAIRARARHSFGYGSACYWCGWDGEGDEPLCDEREHQKPTREEMAVVRQRERAGQAIESLVFDWTYEILTDTEFLKRVRAVVVASAAEHFAAANAALLERLKT